MRLSDAAERRDGQIASRFPGPMLTTSPYQRFERRFPFVRNDIRSHVPSASITTAARNVPARDGGYPRLLDTGARALAGAHRLVTVSNIKPVSGAGFLGTLGESTLSDDKVPTGAELYLIETKRGTALHVSTNGASWADLPARGSTRWSTPMIRVPRAKWRGGSAPAVRCIRTSSRRAMAGFRCGMASSTSVCPTMFRSPP